MVFNVIDVVLFLLILLSVWGGWRRGFILGFLNLLRWLGSLLAGWFFYQPVAGLLASETGLSEVWRQPAAFFLVVLLTSLTIRLLGNALLKRLPRDIHRRLLNRLLGTLPGLTNGLITAAIAAALLFVVPLPGQLREDARESVTANRFAVLAERLTTALMPIFEDALTHTLNRRITIYPESNEHIPLPFKVETPQPRPVLEKQMLEYVNRERAAAGLSPLKLDPALTEVARGHSADMFTRSYFSHYTPEDKSPFDRMRESKVRFLIAGENLALAPSIHLAHTGLMNSPGHRANILRPQFGRIGIGIMDGGVRGLMVTQNFRN
ncbi:CvpA family protein [Methylocaldum sp.]|uniref:CvpA family protein n=1 Tax=Methylocaldum sp. TaxID=1969727 RepID=UPI002D74B4AE|nr:CvpA family protein [Methylocaldum sp.]HYE34058.1 CvpA family protein [Methylocaldum sp.]